jgi:hypothetical protein
MADDTARSPSLAKVHADRKFPLSAEDFSRLDTPAEKAVCEMIVKLN